MQKTIICSYLNLTQQAINNKRTFFGSFVSLILRIDRLLFRESGTLGTWKLKCIMSKDTSINETTMRWTTGTRDMDCLSMCGHWRKIRWNSRHVKSFSMIKRRFMRSVSAFSPKTQSGKILEDQVFFIRFPVVKSIVRQDEEQIEDLTFLIG